MQPEQPDQQRPPWAQEGAPPLNWGGVPVWQAPAKRIGPAPGVEFAGYGSRLIAYILDSLIVSMFFFVTFIIAVAFAPIRPTSVNGVSNITSGQASAWAVLFLVSFLIAILYFPLFWGRSGRTLGMRVTGIRVVRDDDGGRLGVGRGFLRLLGLWVAAAVFYIGFIWIFVDERRRGWHDLIAGTVVISDR